jgi:hypothetical protein
MQTLLSHHWHRLPTGEVLELLETDAQQGLDVFEISPPRAPNTPNLTRTLVERIVLVGTLVLSRRR